MTLVLYDVPSTLASGLYSPSVMKVRYALHYKRLPYITRWVEFPDIQALYQKFGVEPTPRYIIPLLYDPTTDRHISESEAIASYLDEIYTDTPRLFVEESKDFVFLVHSQTLVPLRSLVMPAICGVLNPPSATYYRRLCDDLGLEALSENERALQLERWRVEVGVIDAWMQDEALETGPWLMGDHLSFGDIVAASFIWFLRNLWGEESPEWKMVTSWHDGRWGALVMRMREYEAPTVI